MHRVVILFMFILSPFLGAAEFRTWFNPDKTKSFQAEFVSKNENRVTVRLKNFKTITLEISQLHIDDQLWIKQNASSQNSGANGRNFKQVDPNAVFDNLVFGDNRDAVTKKLFASTLVTSTVELTHIGRTGLNNVFHTRDKIAGLTCSLTFNWSESGELIEVTLQSEDRGAQAYNTDLQTCWKEFEHLLTDIYGKPRRASAMPRTNELSDETMLASHVWKLDQGGSILLGTSKMNGSYQTVVRFTKEVFP